MQSLWKLGPRREILIFLPVALLLLVALSSFALLAHESALERLADEKRQDAVRLATRFVEALRATPDPSEADLARLAPDRQAIQALGVFDQHEAVATLGGNTSERLSPSSSSLGAASAEGPFGDGEIVARAPLDRGQEGGRPRELRVVISARTLGAQLASARLLVRWGLTINAAVALLALFALRQLLGPWEQLLSRAREVSPQAPEDDEVAFLLKTFERATTTLAPPSAVRVAAPEADLAAIEETLSASLRSGLLLLDRHGQVLALNPVGTELLGLSPLELPRPLAEILAPHPGLSALLADAVAAVREVQREECTVGVSGVERTLGLSVHPMRRTSGEVRGFLVLFADLTAAQEREERSRLAESLAQLGEMAGGIAHELRNGLATLKGYLTLASRRSQASEDESLADYLAEMRREAEQLERVLSDFLAFAQPGARTGVDMRSEVDLVALLTRAASDPSLAGTTVDLQVEPNLVGLGDEALLSRALRNLLRNALEAQARAQSREPLKLCAQRVGQEIQITIDDRGPGVPAELRDRLFQPFATGRADGVGLGLALAQRIVTLHGGRITLEDREGGGTRARVDLPASL